MEHKGDKGCDYKSHPPLDHSKSLNDFKAMGIPIYAPYIQYAQHEGIHRYHTIPFSGFKVKAFDLTTIDGNWTHTHANGEPCPIFGFLISHKEMGKMLYITDCEVIKWRFKEIDHILLGVNYDKDMVDWSNPAKNNHVFRGHLEIGTACGFVKANYSDRLQNVIMCHLSSENADSDSFIGRMEQEAPAANVDVAKPNKEWILRRGDEPPF